MAAPAFSPRWMYGPNREAVEVHTQEHMDQVVKDGWQKSPAAFNIETHPQHPVQAIPGTVESVTGMRTSQTLERLVAQVDGMQTTLESVTQRLTALEAAASGSRSAAPVMESATVEDRDSGRRRSS